MSWPISAIGMCRDRSAERYSTVPVRVSTYPAPPDASSSSSARRAGNQKPRGQSVDALAGFYRYFLYNLWELEARFHSRAGLSERDLDRLVTVLRDPSIHPLCNVSRSSQTAMRDLGELPQECVLHRGLQQPRQYTQTTGHSSSFALSSVYTSMGAGDIGVDHSPAETGRD